MENNSVTKLLLIKILHTVVWVFFVVAILYVLYSGISDKITLFTWIAIASVVVEGIVLLINKWRCPLTPIAEKYTDNPVVGFDIFLPSWFTAVRLNTE